MQLTRALQWLHFTAAVVAMAAMGWNATAQTAGPAAKNKAPTASITAPANNSSFPAGSNITISATATDSDGTVTKVDFLAGATVIGTSTTSPYSFVWQNVAVGTYSLTARATDNAGATGTSAAINVTVTPNAPPIVSITSPSNGAVYTAPADVVINATASDSNGTVTRVEFFQGTTSLGFTTSSPYTVTWPNVAPGTYVLTAKATDNQGAVTTSAPVSITVGAPPLVVMTSPDNCSTVPTPANVTLAADAVDIDGWIVSVDFYDGSTLVGSATRLPYSVVWTNAPAGTHTLTARATNNLGITATSVPITLTVAQPNTPPTVNIIAPAAESTFRAGATVAITASASDPDGTVSQVAFYRSGSFIASSNGPVFSVPWMNIPAGDWQLTAIATDNGGASTTSAPVHVIVQPNAAPTAHLTAPANNASYRAPATINFTATAADSDGTVAKVDFLLNGGVVATSTTSPYAATATGVAAGSYGVTARATDNDGATGISPEAVSITVAANALPIVNITSPADNAAITAPTDVPITATASDSDGSIAKVEFFGDGVLLKTVTTAPYSATWANVPLGDRTILVRATDNDGGVSAATATIHVTGIRSEITAPPDGSTYVGPAAFDLVAKLAASSGLLTKVEFYDAGALLTGFDFSPPGNPITFTLQMSQISPGAHVYTAKVFDNASRTATSPPVTVNVIAGPNVTIAYPEANSNFIAPAFMTLSASATPGANPIARVDFYSGSTLLGSATTAPYTFAWSNVAAGNYNLKAIAIDTANNPMQSTIVPVVVASGIVLTLDPGIAGSSVADNRITVTGTAVLPRNGAVLVNGLIAAVDAQGRWFVDNVPLEPGANTLDVSTASLDHDPVTLSTGVTSSAIQPFDVTIDPPEDVGPFSPIIALQQKGVANFGRAELDFDGDGVSDFTITSLTNGRARIQFTASQPGTGSVGVKVFDVANTLIFATTRKYRVMSPDSAGQFMSDEYNEMLQKLTAGDVTGALRRFSDATRDQYQGIFSFLGTRLPAAVAGLGAISDITFTHDSAQIELTRSTPTGNQIFPIQLIRGSDGLWRIESM